MGKDREYELLGKGGINCTNHCELGSTNNTGVSVDGVEEKVSGRTVIKPVIVCLARGAPLQHETEPPTYPGIAPYNKHRICLWHNADRDLKFTG
jgi:hypothetical protein